MTETTQKLFDDLVRTTFDRGYEMGRRSGWNACEDEQRRQGTWIQARLAQEREQGRIEGATFRTFRRPWFAFRHYSMGVFVFPFHKMWWSILWWRTVGPMLHCLWERGMIEAEEGGYWIHAKWCWPDGPAKPLPKI